MLNLNIDFNSLEKNLGELEEKVNDLNSQQNFYVRELLSDSFLEKFSNYNTYKDMIDHAKENNLEVQDLFSGTEEGERFIKDNTDFGTVSELLHEAAKINFRNQLVNIFE
ncbi:hypothetical protein QNK06_10875 [Bacillus subtilis]|uniref:hypothetical protein n=1 Tax=Bacillus subtilis TaxID=1423 RepID=UPI0024C15FE0|nr:hypothetical protein [Bacillus subtilis]WHY07507.1 hypothetical protein QNK06_10875 [Bacillus subtilis]WPP23682.1 hypothetical protein SIS06_11220 [Bacillus subtilis]